MVKYLTFLFLFLIGHHVVTGQKKRFVTVQAGNNIMDILPASEIFLYPQFRSARVFLRNGTMTDTRLNYNRLVDEMHFIDQKSDTLALDVEKDIKYIVVGSDTFCYDEGYVRIISPGKSIKLAIRDVWVISETRQRGAYNSTNTSVGMQSFKSMEQGGRLYDLVVDEDIILKKMEKYYFGDAFNQFVVASKTNLMTLFPKEQQRIGAYLKANRINFNDQKDLEKTVQYLEEIFTQ